MLPELVTPCAESPAPVRGLEELVAAPHFFYEHTDRAAVNYHPKESELIRPGEFLSRCTTALFVLALAVGCGGSGSSSGQPIPGWPVAPFMEQLALSLTPQEPFYVVRAHGLAAPADSQCDVLPDEDRAYVPSNELTQRVVRLELLVDEVLAGPEELTGTVLQVGVYHRLGTPVQTQPELFATALIENWAQIGVYVLEERHCGSGRLSPRFRCNDELLDSIVGIRSLSLGHWFDEADVRATLDWLRANPLPTSCQGLIEAYREATGEDPPPDSHACGTMDWEIPTCLSAPVHPPSSVDAIP